MKAIHEEVGFSKIDASTKCEDLGGFIPSPMNEMYKKDIEDLLSTNSVKGIDFWIGTYYHVTHFYYHGQLISFHFRN